jgi:integrase
MRLTEKFIEKTKPAATRLQFLDDDVRGFGLRVEPNGRKSFFWRAKVRGDIVMRSLGEFRKEIELDQARDDARTLAGKAADWKRRNFEGQSPFLRERIDRSSVPTFSELFEAYVAGQVRPNANRPEKAERDLRWIVKKNFSHWNARPVDSISVEDVLAVKNKCGEHRVQANRCVEFCRTLFNWCDRSTDGKVNFWKVKNPAAEVSRFKEKPRERFLQPDEANRFNECLLKSEHKDLRDFLTLALNTGARKSDLYSMAWRDIHWERNVWLVPHPKNGHAYEVALLPTARTVLERRQSESAESDVFVFPGVGKSKHLVDLKKPWKKFRTEAGLQDITTHDLRRTVGSYLAISGMNLPTIAAALGHKSLGSVKVYARLHNEAVRTARATGQSTMLQLMRQAAKRQKKQKQQKLIAQN